MQDTFPNENLCPAHVDDTSVSNACECGEMKQCYAFLTKFTVPYII